MGFDSFFTADEDPSIWHLFHTDPARSYVLFRVHSPERCLTEHCIIHAPSRHNMRHWPLQPRGNGLYERRCTHGVGHPDPDSVAFYEAQGIEGMDVHGCCGCCRTRRPIRYIKPNST